MILPSDDIAWQTLPKNLHLSSPNENEERSGAHEFPLRAVSVVVVLCLGVVTVIFGWQWREDLAEQECDNRLKAIGLALFNYFDTYHEFPPARLDGHSWRVRMVPYLVSSPYYSNYRFEEPWNSDWNLQLESLPLESWKMEEPIICYPNLFWQCPGERQDETVSHTAYLMLVGPHAFGRKEKGIRWQEITDDPATTIAVAETASHSIHWLQPKDLEVETMSFQINDPEKPSISSHHPHGPHVLFCDGTVAQLGPDLPPEVLKAMITIDGGEKIVRDQNAPGGYHLEEETTTSEAADVQP
ncbi:DUF1559 domain-containing protein [Blastopirellula marina]|uniref:DUF1559 domain-containing protein n=1 Tax=Blastopirellula marina TaxID=124 RepID=A0A2S8G0J7_9BACT|nr:DUF1559 domain-containing protein [Blastopirellula marina]PQO37972.1 hypothetical protein C5Y98_07720 [Blastopirellula marina]PTL44628.1 DUF1559 domain-containing protein [Blastopirellula marina]